MPPRLLKVVDFIRRIPTRILLGLIWIYQHTLSPAFPLLLGPNCGCRFYPSCSRYSAEALRTHGALRGTWLTARRLLRCTPLHPGGVDLVPTPRQKLRPTCVRS